MEVRQKKIAMSIGGNLIYPESGLSISFLSKLNTFIRSQVKNNPNLQFFLVAGGGTLSKNYRRVGRKVIKHKLSTEDLDWLGIHATRLNAQLISTIFRDIAHPFVIKRYDIIRRIHEPVVIASGWKPGWSTDFCNTLICEDYNIKTVISLSTTDMVYDKDPNKYKNAKGIEKITWKRFRKLVGNKWIPGAHFPFDPIASKKAQELKLNVVVLNGNRFKNIENYLSGKKFTGTIISDSIV